MPFCSVSKQTQQVSGMCSAEDQALISSSSNTSSSSSSSPFSSSPLLPISRNSISNRKTMEEVWKDISLNNLQEKPIEMGRKGFREMILQDFLARPNKETQSNEASNLDSVDMKAGCNNLDLFNSAASSTILSLNSGPDLQYMNWLSFQSKNTPPVQRHSYVPQPENRREFAAAFSGETVSGLSCCKRQFPDSCSDDKSVDRRHKRMIKNRESAARSRARKQAYTNELEHEVAQLMEENARLRKQHQQMNSANHSSTRQLPKTKQTLWRTLTAPF